MEKENMALSITWVTAGCFLQVDLPLLSELKESFDIHWILVNRSADKKKTADSYAQKYGIQLEHFDAAGHWLNPIQYLEYIKLAKRIAAIDSDICYLDMSGFPYALFALEKHIPAEKIVIAMHHGKIHSGMRLKPIYKHYLSYLCSRPFRFQYFSESQAAYFTGEEWRKTVIPLALNDFGTTCDAPPTTFIQFLYFGNIIDNKNLGLLIEAACRLKETCQLPFKVKIVGHCRNWNAKYQGTLRYKDIFDLDIRTVPDTMIPQLFSTAHYLVLPYKSVTQSGPLRIAYSYNLPVIASDLEGFKESVVDGVTGILFKNNDVESLTETMRRLVEGGQKAYAELKEEQLRYVNDHLAISSVVEKYKDMFHSIAVGGYGSEK